MTSNEFTPKSILSISDKLKSLDQNLKDNVTHMASKIQGSNFD
jgi:hypothetical protein